MTTRKYIFRPILIILPLIFLSTQRKANKKIIYHTDSCIIIEMIRNSKDSGSPQRISYMAILMDSNYYKSIVYFNRLLNLGAQLGPERRIFEGKEVFDSLFNKCGLKIIDIVVFSNFKALGDYYYFNKNKSKIPFLDSAINNNLYYNRFLPVSLTLQKVGDDYVGKYHYIIAWNKIKIKYQVKTFNSNDLYNLNCNNSYFDSFVVIFNTTDNGNNKSKIMHLERSPYSRMNSCAIIPCDIL